MRTKGIVLTIAIIAGAATTADAQGRGRGRADERVPPGQRPPAGMCRIWINGVPPGRQPAPTDCETAVRNQPANSQIIWGENTRRGRTVADTDRPRRERTRRGGGIALDAHGHEYDPSCVDNDRNGWCDYHPEMRSSVHAGTPPTNPSGEPTPPPVDRGQYPSQLPAMTGAVLIRVGVRTADVEGWLGRTDVRSETVDSNGDGVPEQATWYDNGGNVLQVWRDEDRDGRADSVEVYRNGQRVHVVR